MKIKLVTYNIFHGRYFKGMLEFLRSEQPDIVCLQEVGTEGRAFEAVPENLYENISDDLGMVGEYEHMFRGNVGKGEFTMGVAVLSRFPILQKKAWVYEREMTEEVLESVEKDRYNLPRKLLGVELRVGSKNLWVFTTHFTITPDAQPRPYQIGQARKVREFLDEFEEYIFCGDMNTAYKTETYLKLAEGHRDVSLPEQPSLHPTLHPVGHLGLHVDYVFLKGNGLRTISSKVPVVDGSDHLPVVVELEVEG